MFFENMSSILIIVYTTLQSYLRALGSGGEGRAPLTAPSPPSRTARAAPTLPRDNERRERLSAAGLGSAASHPQKQTWWWRMYTARR